MEATQIMMNTSLTTTDDNGNECSKTDTKLDTTTTTTTTTTPSSSPPEEEEAKGCRKSSRLKAKKAVRQSQDTESEEAYNLRLSSLVKRVQVERRQSTPKQPKGKSKPPPLSKYRRRTANARERLRMKEINEGFERLRDSLPEMEQLGGEGKKKEKPTKLTVLNLALNYIHALRDILGYPAFGGEDGSSSSSINGEGSSSSISGEGSSSSCSGGEGSSSSSSSSRLSEESDLGSDAASTRTLSTSCASCDELCSNPSPDCPSLLDLKDFSSSSLSDVPPSPYLTPALPKHGAGCYDSASSSSSSCLMDFRGEARSSPSSSDLSLPPTPPPLPLPEECMDIDQADLLDVTISLAELGDMDDIML